jgi:hypothetical protein
VGPEWDLEPGDTILRKDLHRKYGGAGQGGIEPSARTPNVFVFSDLDAGQRYGYIYDRWEQGVFLFTGDGQTGDQVMKYGNRAIRDHVKDGRALRVFLGARGRVRYQGEFELAANPYYMAQARGRDSERVRQVIVFRLVPIRRD